MARLAIGVDVGGSAIKAALVDEHGAILDDLRRPTPTANASAEEVVDAIIESGTVIRDRAVRRGFQVEGVGFGMPNYSLGPEWVQTVAANVPALEGFALFPALHDAFGSAIACDLDSHAATIGELRFGTAAGFERVIFIAIGTGISCGIVVDGSRLLRYTYGSSGDTGHLIVDPSGLEACTCGGRGCLETVTSARAIRKHALEAVRRGESELLAELRDSRRTLEAEDVTEAAHRGDRVAANILDRAGRGLGVALTSLMHVYCPQAVLVGGGVADAGELLLAPARATIDRLASPFYRGQLEALRTATLGRDAGVIGAATLILFPPTSD